MEQISCPSCGKPNSADNKFCDFCLSALHPGGSGEEVFGAPVPPLSGENREGLGGHESDAEVPEWLSEIQQSKKAEAEEPLGTESDKKMPEDSVSDWMSEVSESGQGKSDPEPTAPFLTDQEISGSQEIPHWLNDALIDEGSPGSVEREDFTEIPISAGEPGSSLKDLPDTPFSEETLGDLENAGPLAGLTGILSAEAGAARAKTPKAYSSSLKISSSQRAHIDLLIDLVKDEGQPHLLPERKAISQQNVMRWVIALVLLVAILWPLVVSSDQMPFPVYDEGSSEVNRLINQLPENARVLVGFDFEPLR